MSDPALKTTPLTDGHVALGGRMVAFAGYSMPLHYREGILKEHLWTRAHASAFDVSHMGPAFLHLNERTGDAEADHRRAAAIVERLVCGDIAGLKPGQMRYTLLLNAAGGILDDLIVGRPAESERAGSLYVVVNAGTKEADFDLLRAAAEDEATLERADERAFIAVQGPMAAAAVEAILPDAGHLSFMAFKTMAFEGESLVVSRSGYTGEDGFEILAPPGALAEFGHRLLSDDEVRPAGLGARDSLRLEAGLPLYGHDLDETTSPVEAGLAFAVARRRLRAADFPGAQRVARELADGPRRLRIGLRVLEGAPAREGAQVLSEAGAGVGAVTSGGFSPTLSAPIAMAFFTPPDAGAVGAPLQVVVRGRAQPAQAVAMPFVPHRYHRARSPDALHQGS